MKMKEMKEKKENKEKPGQRLLLVNLLFNKNKEVSMVPNFDLKYLFEDPEISNFQFWANPETFEVSGDGYKVDGILAVVENGKTQNYDAILYFFPAEQNSDGCNAYRSEFLDWWLELKNPNQAIIVENGRLIVKNEEEV